MYRVNYETIVKERAEFMGVNSAAFVPFSTSNVDGSHILHLYKSVLAMQNGSDIDDYVIDDNNKGEKFLKGFSSGTKVLLLGTGTGREVLVAKEMGYVAVGTTLGRKNILFGRQILGLTEEEIIECNNDALPLASGYFDVVAGFQVVEHSIAPLLFVLEQTRVLRTGGLLLFEWPPSKLFNMDENPHHQICFAPGQLESLFKKAGLVNIKLFYDDLSSICEDDKWRCDQNKMLCISGIKAPSQQRYINDCRY